MRNAVSNLLVLSFCLFLFSSPALAGLGACDDHAPSIRAEDCQWVVQPGTKAPELNVSLGARLNGHTEDVLFANHVGLRRFVSNTGSAHVFVPQRTAAEFEAFLGFSPPIMSAYAVPDLNYDYSSHAQTFDGCLNTVFAVDPITNSTRRVLVTGSNATTPLMVVSSHSKLLKNTSATVVVGNTDLDSPIRFTYTRPPHYTGDCIYDNENNEHCAAVTFVQSQSIPFTTGPENGDYVWKPGIGTPVLRVSLNGGAFTPASDCTSPHADVAPTIVAACGTAHGENRSTQPPSIPASTLCSFGNASSVTGSGPWQWKCYDVSPTGPTANYVSCQAGPSACEQGSAVSWDDGGSNQCTASTLSKTNSGSTIDVTATGIKTGSATFRCDNGVLTAQTKSCGAACLAGSSVSWLSSPSCSGHSAYTINSGANILVASDDGTHNGQATYTCSNGTLTRLADPSPYCSTPVNGQCGGSNGGTYSTAPTSDLCATGTASPASGGWNWACQGSGGGGNASCVAYYHAAVNGQCGGANGGTGSTPPTSSLCTAGTPNPLYGGAWNWTCGGQYGGTPVSCSATYVAPPTPINGSCGSANNTLYITPPAANLLCSITGTTPTVTGDGPWNWNCTGVSGGQPVSCATTYPAAINAVCGTAKNNTTSTAPTSYLCVDGSTPTVNGPTYDLWYWLCLGKYHGNNASCASAYHVAVNAACGSATAGTTATAPAANLCADNSTPTVSGPTSGKWTWTCAGQYGGGGASCNSTYQAAAQCPAGTKTWTVGASTCSGSVPLTNSSSSYTASETNGQATYSCNNGTWTETSKTCTKSCSNTVTSSTTLTVPAGLNVTIAFGVKGGGGGGSGYGGTQSHGSGGSPGGGGGSSAVKLNGVVKGIGRGGNGGTQSCGSGGTNTPVSFAVVGGNTVGFVIGGGGGGGGNGNVLYSGDWSLSGGGGGGAGYGGGSGAAVNVNGSYCAGSGGAGGGDGTTATKGADCTATGGAKGGGPGPSGSGGASAGTGITAHGGGGAGGGASQKGGNGVSGAAGGNSGDGTARPCGDNWTDNGGITGGRGGLPGWITYSYTAPTCSF